MSKLYHKMDDLTDFRSTGMHRILGRGALRRGRRVRSLIILFKSMRLGQCALAIFRLLFSYDLWPFGLSINTTTPMQEDVPFARSMLSRRTTFKKFCGRKINMISMAFKVLLPLAVFCSATADLRCNSTVGLETGELPNKSVHASSYRNGHNPYLGRLNNKIRKINETKRIWGAWCAFESNSNQYLEVDLQLIRNVSGVATQGYEYGGYVKSYQISYSVNRRQWYTYKENGTVKTFDGNHDKNTIVQHRFDRLLPVQFIRFNPVSWESICMRVEVYACEIPEAKVTTTVATMEETSMAEKVTTPSSTFKSTDVEATEKKTEDNAEELSTSKNGVTFDDRKNAGSWSRCSIPVLFACLVLVLNRFLY